MFFGMTDKDERDVNPNPPAQMVLHTSHIYDFSFETLESWAAQIITLQYRAFG